MGMPDSGNFNSFDAEWEVSETDFFSFLKAFDFLQLIPLEMHRWTACLWAVVNK